MASEKLRKTFLSYSRHNKDFAVRLAKELKSEGFNVWLDQLDIPAGARWDREVEKALRESDIFMIILTPASVDSENVLDEIGYAIDTGKRFLPVLLEKCDVPLRLRRFQYVDFTNKDFDDGVESAKELLRSLIAQPTVPRGMTVSDLQAEAERKAKQEEEKIAEQKAEEEQLAKIKADRKTKEESDRLAAKKAEEERLARLKVEEEQVVKAKAEADRKAKEEIDRKAKVEADRKAKVEADRLAKAETDREAIEETEGLAAQKAEATRQANEKIERLTEQKAKAGRETKPVPAWMSLPKPVMIVLVVAATLLLLLGVRGLFVTRSLSNFNDLAVNSPLAVKTATEPPPQSTNNPGAHPLRRLLPPTDRH